MEQIRQTATAQRRNRGEINYKARVTAPFCATRKGENGRPRGARRKLPTCYKRSATVLPDACDLRNSRAVHQNIHAHFPLRQRRIPSVTSPVSKNSFCRKTALKIKIAHPKIPVNRGFRMFAAYFCGLYSRRNLITTYCRFLVAYIHKYIPRLARKSIAKLFKRVKADSASLIIL